LQVDGTMMEPPRILGVILAGGEGRRVGGQDKGLLPVHGKPVIERVLSILRTQCDEVLIVANRNRDEYTRYSRVIADETSGHAGPLAGIAAAFALVAERERPGLGDFGWLLTSPVDCPHLPSDLFARLHAALQSTAGSPCAFASNAHRREPLFALYALEFRDALLASARAALNVHASPLRWHMELDAVPVDFSDSAEAFRNLNTPEDFREYEQAHP
jgi:molybdenum cofactor guanylyltransferase